MLPNSKIQETLDLLKIKEFRAFMTLRFVLMLGLYAQFTALGYFLYERTKDPLALGYMGLAEFIPAIIFSVISGYITDKNDKQKIYKNCVYVYLVNAIVLGLVILPQFADKISTFTLCAVIYCCIFFSGVARSFLAPASFSILPMLVPSEKYAQGITISTTSWYLGNILGPLACGACIAISGVNLASLLVFVCMVLSVFAIHRIAAKPAVRINKKEPILQSLQQGFQFVFRSPIILACLCLDLFAVLFGGAETLLPIFRKILEVGPIGFGLLRSAHGIGSVFLTLIMVMVPLKTNVGKKLLASVFMYGVCIILFAVSKNFYWSFILLFCGGMMDCISVVIRHSVLQHNTPAAIKGRVASINNLFISSSNELGGFESGLAAKLMGTVPSVVFGGGMTLVVVIATAILAPSLRKMKSLNQ
jgi:MFS family permease